MIKKIDILFAAGAVGGLAFALLMWGFGEMGIAKMLKVELAPALKGPFIYHSMIWGGIWGMLFILPVYDKKRITKGLLLSLIPAFMELLYFMPNSANNEMFGIMGSIDSKRGYFGQHLGTLTPVLIFIYYAAWGIVTSFWIKMSGER